MNGTLIQAIATFKGVIEGHMKFVSSTYFYQAQFFMNYYCDQSEKNQFVILFLFNYYLSLQSQVATADGQSDVNLEGKLWYGDSQKKATRNHNWHVHLYTVSGSDCAITGGHYNPFAKVVTSPVCIFFIL